MTSTDNRIRVILLTGFLGAGKTTLLNQVLASLGENNCSLLINEFGEIGFDGTLVESADETLVEISNGCICCTMRGEVSDAMLKLAEYKREWLIIETTGLANPLPLIQTTLGHPQIAELYRLQSVLTVIDSLQSEQTARQFSQWREQTVFADCLYLSKTDRLQDEATKSRILKQLAELNPLAPVHDRNGLDDLLDILRSGTPTQTVREDVFKSHHHHHHGDQFHSIALSHDQPVAAEALEMFLTLIGSAYSDRVLRMKGIVEIEGQDTPMFLQSVGGHHDLVPVVKPQQNATELSGYGEKNQQTRIIAIVQEIDPDLIRKLFAGFIGKTEIDTPDRQALSNNPLSIAGDWKIGN